MHRTLIPLWLFLALPHVRAEERPAAAERQATSWIWKNAEAVNGERVFFRREFQLPPDVVCAEVTVVCDDWQRVFINGCDMGAGKGWKCPRSYDVFSKLKPGSRNVIAVEGHNDTGLAGMALCLRATLKCGKILQIVTDANWLCSNDAPDGWQNLDFASPSWTKSIVIAKMGDPPWRGVMKTEAVDPVTTAEKTPVPTPGQ